MTNATVAEKRMNAVFEALQSLHFVRVTRHSPRSVVLHFTSTKSHAGLMLSATRDRNLDVVYCESALYYPSGAVGSYPGMPDVLFSLEETMAEIYRFYFLMFCLSKIMAKKTSFLFAIPKKRKPLSLQTLSMACLSTTEMHHIRQDLCMAWAY
jgi:hypothetical protein